MYNINIYNFLGYYRIYETLYIRFILTHMVCNYFLMNFILCLIIVLVLSLTACFRDSCGNFSSYYH